ncbi:MAG: NUDIX domain-containing protein, partial [Chitinophagales bacterium]
MKYRVSARGVVVENNTVLFIEYEDEDNKTYYSLPGGGQEVNTDLAQTVQNEFLEEVGIEVSVGDILLVREFIISNPNIKIWSKGIHQ